MFLRIILRTTTFIGIAVLGFMLTSQVVNNLQDIDHLADASPDRVVKNDAAPERPSPAIQAERIRTAITDLSQTTRDGYPDAMPAFDGFSDDEIEGLVAFIRSLE